VKPPRNLTRAARALWAEIRTLYAIEDDDTPALLLVESIAGAWQTMTAAAAVLNKEGATVRDRWGQPRAHPAAAIARDARAGLVAALRALDVKLAPPSRGRMGRPRGPMTVLRKQELGLR
jgi:phage terminase small subunit